MIQVVSIFCFLQAVLLFGAIAFRLLTSSGAVGDTLLLSTVLFLFAAVFLALATAMHGVRTTDELFRRLSRFTGPGVETLIHHGVETGKPALQQALFISYARTDKAWLDRLCRHLEPLARSKDYRILSDQGILVGDEWEKAIMAMMYEAKISISLLSPDFVQSSFIQTREIPVMMERRKIQQLRPTWVLLRRCEVPDDFRRLQAAHDVKTPVEELRESEQEAELARIANRTLL